MVQQNNFSKIFYIYLFFKVFSSYLAEFLLMVHIPFNEANCYELIDIKVRNTENLRYPIY